MQGEIYMFKLLKPASLAIAVSLATGCATTTTDDTADSVVPKVTELPAAGKKVPAKLKSTRSSREKVIYPDSTHTSFLGEDKQLKLIYGVEKNKAFYRVKNNSKEGYLVTIKFDDGTEARHEVSSYSMTETINFPIKDSIENWTMKSWTSRETLDENESSGIRFGWRTFKGEKQFRLHNSNETYIDVTYYYEEEGPEKKTTIKVMPKGSCNWRPYKGGNIVTTFNN